MKFLKTATIASLLATATSAQSQERDLFYVMKDSSLPYFYSKSIPMDGGIVQECLRKQDLAYGVRPTISQMGDSLWVDFIDTEGRSTRVDIYDRDKDGRSDYIVQSFPTFPSLELKDENYDGLFDIAKQ